jgi:TniQ
LTDAVRPFPVVLPALPDELLSSWLQRHADFYGVSGGRLLRHCGLDAMSLRSLDFTLTAYNQRRLARALRSDQRVIRKMMQSCGRSRPEGLIATDRPMQVCKRCRGRHQAEPETRGARLRSWMEGWRLSCPLCGTHLEDSRPLNLLMRADPAGSLLVRIAEHAAEGELIMGRAVRRKRAGGPLVTLMRSLLLPRARPQQGSPVADIPRLLEMVVPGFDDFLRHSYPGFRRPGTLLLPMSIRIPVLAGVSRVARRPTGWAESLLGAVDQSALLGLTACFRELGVH